jgi:hypothetical protein
MFGWLHLHDAPLNKLVSHGQIEKQYLAWETVRLQTNPYFIKGTGFEGYFVGVCPNPEAALEAILATNQGILDAIARFYRYDYGLRTRLMRTLMRESSDPKAIHIWSAYLGAALGRLRCQVSTSKEAVLFQTRTYRIVGSLPPISYQETQQDVRQLYAVGADEIKPVGRLAITVGALNPGQQEAWLVAQRIGEFGHPLVRKILDAA